MDIGCLFAPTTHTPDHIAEAERLGYGYAYVYDSPSLFANAWMTLGRAADRTARIRLGVAVVTPKLRHLVDNASGAVTLAALAPGRVDVVVGAGFTSAALLGRRGSRWAEVEEYILALRALMAGEEIDWEGARIALTFPGHSGLAPVTDVPVLAAAHGPKGFAVASRVADGVVTNPSHSSDPIPFEGRCVVTSYGTVLGEGEELSSPRVVDAAGPGAALALHLGEYGPLAGTDEVRGYQAWLASVPEERRHIETHREHLIGVTPEERPFITPKVIESATATGAPQQIRERLEHLEQSGATTVAYQPAGPDISRELRAFAAAAGL
ncbi:LLM class flavin-dependent oxidoreductase [Streptomyces phyllanthi]|uniref:LLM class flavin-dependent oxidoreductase n=2 Tax=Streptomyces phyllanthi TaxID=1803180 RepID=A0A5N8W3D1_9ACTN|nr:LLM class flavin-dependent oxidoreductase [Streptomyces phyllanthi]